jgi:hemerythrin-like metal-binding protein
MLSHYSSKLEVARFHGQYKEVERVTDLLLDYAEEHFFVEETLIESAGDTADHIHQHRNFSKNFNLMRLQRIGDPDSSPSRKTLIDTSDFLRKWIVSHIAIHDMAYVKKIFHSRNKKRFSKIG